MSLEEILRYMAAENRYFTLDDIKRDVRGIQELIDAEPEREFSISEIARQLNLTVFRVKAIMKSGNLKYSTRLSSKQKWYSSTFCPQNNNEKIEQCEVATIKGLPIILNNPNPFLGLEARREFYSRCAYRPKKKKGIVVNKF